MKNKNNRGFFDEQFRLEKLSKQNDPLLKLLHEIEWEQFRRILTNAFEKEEKGIGGRPPFDYVMMFKIIVLQRYYNLSDSVPDEKTIWLFRENLIQLNLIEKLFAKFLGNLEKA